MKKIIIALFIASSLFTACTTNDTANVSTVTYFPIFTIIGPNPYFVTLGTPYTDPGAIAKAGETILPVTTTAKGKYRGATTMDTNKVDEYAVTYSATNSDGFVGTGTRKVIVWKNGDLVNSIEGLYTCTISRNGAIPNANYRNIKYLYIWKNADGSYEVSDACGGWYEYGRGLGVGYITPGGKILAVDIPSNTFTFPGSLTNTGFGGVAKITDLTVNAATKTVVLTSSWLVSGTAYTFIATMTQVQP